MAQSTAAKKEIIEKFKTHEGDTGSCEVQIALLTDRIQYLTDHFKTHSKDHHSRRGHRAVIGRTGLRQSRVGRRRAQCRHRFRTAVDRE